MTSRDFSIIINKADVMLSIFSFAIAMFFITGFRLFPEYAQIAWIFLGYQLAGWVGIIVEELLLSSRTKNDAIRIYNSEPDLEYWLNVVTIGLLVFVGIIVAQVITFSLDLSISTFQDLNVIDRLFGFLAGDSEEVFFRGLLLRWTLRALQAVDTSSAFQLIMVIVAVIINSTIFAVMHVFVYGQDFSKIFAVFVSTIPICAGYLASRSMTSSRIGHIILNAGLRVVI